MKFWYLFFLVLIISSCSTSNDPNVSLVSSRNYKIVQDSIFKTFSKDREVSSVEFSREPQKVVVLATPIYSYIKALGSESNVVGMLALDRLSGISSSIQNVGTNYEIDQEKIIELSPDLIICNSFQLKGISRLKSKYQILIVDEYLETNPLMKASWIEFFGALFRKETKSNNIYTEIKRNYVPFSSANVKVVQLNNYGGKWYLPGCKSYISQIIRDSGAKTDCDSQKSGSDVISEESAMVKLNSLDYLLFFDSVKDTSGLRDRLRPALELIKGNKLNVLYCNTLSTRFFEKSILNPDIILNELNALIKSKKEGRFFKLITLEN